MVDISRYVPKQSKYKKILKKHGISVGTVANYLKLSYPYVCNILNGVHRMPPEAEKKIQKLVDQLEAS